MSVPPRCEEKPAWSGKQLRRLGECIRDEVELPPAPDYADVMIWYSELAATVQEHLREVDWSATCGLVQQPEITSRAKTLDTLREKLQRDHSTPLPSIQDVAGVRLEAEMAWTQQDAVVSQICRQFGANPSDVRDIRANPHSGYRAVHVWLRLPAGRVEVQVRTHLQGQWANVYEKLADLLGRGIRYAEVLDDPAERQIVERLQELSTGRGRDLEDVRDKRYVMGVRLAGLRATIDGLDPRVDSDQYAGLVRDVEELEEEQVQALEVIRRREADYSGTLADLEVALDQVIARIGGRRD